MAFFGVTNLGYQNVFRGHLNRPVVTPISLFQCGKYREKDYLKYYDLSNLYPVLYRNYAIIPLHAADQNDCCRTKSYEELCRLKKIHCTGLGSFRKHPSESATISSWYTGEHVDKFAPWARGKILPKLESKEPCKK